MSDTDENVQENGLPLAEMGSKAGGREEERDFSQARGAADLEAVFDVPVQISAVLGHSRMHVSELKHKFFIASDIPRTLPLMSWELKSR